MGEVGWCSRLHTVCGDWLLVWFGSGLPGPMAQRDYRTLARDRLLIRVAACSGVGCAAIVGLVAMLCPAVSKGRTATQAVIVTSPSHTSAALYWSGATSDGPGGGSTSGGDVVTVVPVDGGSDASTAPVGGPVSVVPEDQDGFDSGNGSDGLTNGGAPAVPGRVDGSNSGQVALSPTVSTPTVCNRMIADLTALHAALLAATATDVFCLRGSDSVPTAINAVAFARAALGTPYVWGGTGKGSGGYDCSGLTSAAYAAAGLHLPRTAQLQYNAIPKLPAGAEVQPGDLVFFGSGPRSVTHVGIAISSTQMINAPQTGEVVKIAPLHRRDLVGIGRPSDMRIDPTGRD